MAAENSAKNTRESFEQLEAGYAKQREDDRLLVQRVGLTTYMEDESDQYVMLTKTFVESLNSATPLSGHLLHLRFMIGLLL